MKKVIAFIVMLSFFLAAGMATAATHLVPGDYFTIQKAINASSSGDTVLVSDGYYHEHLTLKSSVDVIGEGVRTRIIGDHTGSVVTATDVTNAEFSGFWIYWSGANTSDAGIKISGGSLVVSNTRISHCSTRGIYISGGSSAIIRNNVIQYNGDDGNAYTDYGIICLSSTPLISNNIIRENYAVGIYFAWTGSNGAQVINNTIADNDDFGIWCCCESQPIIKNNISVNNGTGISASHGALPVISYNDVWGNSWHNYDSQSGGVAAPGPGDISLDPLFSGDNPTKYYLTEESPCIDAGDPNPVYNDIDGSRNDMGVWGGPLGSNTAPGFLTSGFLFTSIGKIPTSEITQTGDRRGLANVSSAVHIDLGIYQYTDSPFGGRLWLQGLFGADDDDITYYKIMVAKWVSASPPPPSAFVPLKDPLTKIKYTINPDGTVNSERITLGPLSMYGQEGIYKRTNTGYWAHRDLKMIWNTAWMENGTYDIMYKAYKVTCNTIFCTLTEVVLPHNNFERITVVVNNSPVNVEIHSVHYDGGAEITECDIIDLESDEENLKFYITASHPEGYLLDYNLSALYGKNHNAGTIASDNYDDAAGVTPPVWPGVSNQLFNSADAMAAGSLATWTECAHQFRLHARARTTDGYNYIKRGEFNDHYFIQINACAADINRDGVVDGADLAEFAESYGSADCF